MNTGGYLDYLGSVHAHADICIVLPVLDIGTSHLLKAKGDLIQNQ